MDSSIKDMNLNMSHFFKVEQLTTGGFTKNRGRTWAFRIF